MNVVEGARTSPEVQPPKRNNYVHYKGGGYIIRRIKYLIAFESLLGINRLYLIGCRNCFGRFCYTYNAILVLTSIILIIIIEMYSASQLLYRNTVVIEYLLLALSAMFLQRKPLNTFFSQLQSLDEKLNICDDIKLTSPIRFCILGISAITVYSILEHTLYTIGDGVVKYGIIYAASLGLVVHDIELIFFSVLIVMVSRRLRVIKAHVAKLYLIESVDIGGSANIMKLEALAKKANLDVSSLHRAYDLLYKCSQQLNSIMTFPITVMIVTAGFTTILTLKNLIHILQTEQNPYTRDDTAIKVVIAIGIGRTVKYIVFLIVPCYYASVTKTQVDIIRTILNDILNNNTEDKVERRKLKAFSQLCQDNAFLYEMWGVLRLDMTLPLSYSSLCTTYLIIFVQFSRFID